MHTRGLGKGRERERSSSRLPDEGGAHPGAWSHDPWDHDPSQNHELDAQATEPPRCPEEVYCIYKVLT